MSPWSLGLGILAVIVVYVLLERTYAGLKLKATGASNRAAFLLGVPTWQYGLLAFGVCGALAGLAGADQVTGVYHRLIPAVSSGYGYLGLMIGMLILYRAIWVAPVGRKLSKPVRPRRSLTTPLRTLKQTWQGLV